MAKAITDSSHYAAVAGAIREGTGEQTRYRPSEMASGVRSVFFAGMKREHDHFWDAYQDNGARTTYANGFYGGGWTDENFKPKYDFVLTTCGGMFNNARIKDFKGILAQQGVVFDTSACTSINSMFYSTNPAEDKAITVPAVDASSAVGVINGTYYGQSRLTEVELLNIQKSATFQRAFFGCKELVNLIITGTIGGEGLDLSSATRLSKESIERVVNCLAVSTEGIAVTLSMEAVNRAFETKEGAEDGVESDEWAMLVNTRTNWTVNLI